MAQLVEQLIRFPMFSDEAERAVLGGLICGGAEILPKIKLKPSDFYLQQNQILYSIICNIYREKGTVDIVLVREYLRTHPNIDLDIDYVIVITGEHFSTTNALMYSQYVRGYAKVRAFVDVLNTCIEGINRGQFTESVKKLRDDLIKLFPLV